MKLFDFLKSKTGKLVMGVPQLAAIGGAGLMLTYGAFKTDQIMDKDQPLRTLSSVSASSSYEGLNRRADGMLSSMNIQNRGVAVGAERARLEGTSSNNDFGLAALDNLESRISVPGVGQAASSSATDGLGSGGVDMVEIGPGASGGSRAAVSGGTSGVAVQGAGASANGASASGSGASGQLASASMARASGGSFNSSGFGGSGAAGGISASRSGSPSLGGAGAGSEGYQFSGAMPSGSNIVSSYTGRSGARANSSFGAGSRDASVGRGGRRVNEKDDLKRISKMSAEVAKDRNRSAVGGARPFLAESATSGGLSLETGGEVTTTGSADLSQPEARKLKAIGDWKQETQDKGDNREKARTRLMWMTLALIAAALGTMAFAGGLIFKGRMQMMLGQAMLPYAKTAGAALLAKGRLNMALGWGAIALAGAYAGVVLGFAIDYMAKYSGGFMPILATIASVGALVGLTMVGVKAMRARMFSSDIVKFQGQVVGVLKHAGVAGASTVAQNVISKAVTEK